MKTYSSNDSGKSKGGDGIINGNGCGSGGKDDGKGGGSGPVRLHKLLAEAGVASRRKCEGLIAAGRVRVDGVVVSVVGAKAARGARIEVDGAPIHAPRGRDLAYVLLNKPSRCVSSVSDPQGRRTVLDVVHGAPPFSGEPLPKGARIYPVGRLDYNTTGLLLLTNDGSFALFASHPRNGVEKVYEATLEASPGEGAVSALRAGVTLDDGFTCAPARVSVREEEPQGSKDGRGMRHVVAVAVREGRNRQVRRMFEAVGLGAVRLRRVAIGGIDLRAGRYAALPVGSWMRVTHDEAMRVAGSAALNR